MYAIIAQVVRNMSMDIKRMPIAIAKDISEFLYLHLLRAITTVAWQSSGRCKKEEIVLSSDCLDVRRTQPICWWPLYAAGRGRSTRLVKLFSLQYFLCDTSELSILNDRCRCQWSRCIGKEFYHFLQRRLHLSCVVQHNRHDQIFQSLRCRLMQCVTP